MLPYVTSTSTRQYSDETLMTAEALLAISERPSTSLSQSVDVVMQTPDPEVILPGELRTVATRLCDPLAITLPLHHSTPLEPPSSHETPTRFGTQHISPVSHQSQTPSEVFTSTRGICRGGGSRGFSPSLVFIFHPAVLKCTIPTREA